MGQRSRLASLSGAPLTRSVSRPFGSLADLIHLLFHDCDRAGLVRPRSWRAEIGSRRWSATAAERAPLDVLLIVCVIQGECFLSSSASLAASKWHSQSSGSGLPSKGGPGFTPCRGTHRRDFVGTPTAAKKQFPALRWAFS